MTLAPPDMGPYTEAERRWGVWLMEEPQLVEIEYTRPLDPSQQPMGKMIDRRKLEVAPVLASEIQGRFTRWRIQGVTWVLDQYVETRRGEVQYSTRWEAYQAIIKIHVRAHRDIRDVVEAMSQAARDEREGRG